MTWFERHKTTLGIGLVIALSLIMHAGIFKKDLLGLHVWRQTQTQNTTLSFAEEDINILNPRKNERGAGDGIFRMEFPLSQWIIALPVRVLGHDVFISRLFNYFFGLLSLLALICLFKWYRLPAGVKIAGAVLFLFTPVIYYYMVNPLPDNLALCLATWGVYFGVRFNSSKQTIDAFVSALFITVATLVKLPFVFYFILPGILVLKHKPKIIYLLIITAVPAFLWYWWVIPDWEGNGIVSGILNMTHEQKADYWGYTLYHLRSTLPELLLGYPALLFFGTGLIQLVKYHKKSWHLKLAFLLVITTLALLMLFEMNMIEKVHDYYFLPFVPLLVLISVVGAKKWLDSGRFVRVRQLVAILCLMGLILSTGFRIQARWERPGFNTDLLTHKQELRQIVPDDALVLVGNDPSHHIFLYYIHKKGWAFENNWTNEHKIMEMMQQGCAYLYCDSRHVDQNPRIIELFGTKLASFGTINVYKLRDPNGLLGDDPIK